MKWNVSFCSVLIISLISLSGCDSSGKDGQKNTAVKEEVQQDKAEVLPYLNIQEQPAQIALPFCESKNCIDIDIQTVKTQDSWLNEWIAKNQATVIQNQIGLKQNMTLQQAVNAYVKKSDTWQDEFSANKPYALNMYTRVAYQRNQYLLLQLGVDTQQEDIKVKERYYFFVADRKNKKSVTLLESIKPEQQTALNTYIQTAYQKWLKEQKADIRKEAPAKLYWGQSDWFFDQEGLGLHFRTSEIVKDGTQLDIYLTKAQTQQVLKADVYQNMF